MISFRDRIKSKIRTLRHPLYGFSALLLVCWLIGFLVFNLRGLIHIVLIVAFVLILIKLIKARNSVEDGIDLK